jgi:transposase
MNSDKFIDFMRRLIYDVKKKVFFIVDNLRVHYSRKVRAWLEKHKDRIEVFYLPPYSPEYNPDELLNANLKRDIGNRTMPKSEKDLEHNVRSHMKMLQLAPEKVSSFFDAPFTGYAG